MGRWSHLRETTSRAFYGMFAIRHCFMSNSISFGSDCLYAPSVTRNHSHATFNLVRTRIMHYPTEPCELIRRNVHARRDYVGCLWFSPRAIEKQIGGASKISCGMVQSILWLELSIKSLTRSRPAKNILSAENLDRLSSSWYVYNSTSVMMP